MLADLSQSEVSLAYDYGKHLGLAFQYVDDVLDFTGSESGMGKQRLADLGVWATKYFVIWCTTLDKWCVLDVSESRKTDIERFWRYKFLIAIVVNDE